jgi:hypothetical protein
MFVRLVERAGIGGVPCKRLRSRRLFMIPAIMVPAIIPTPIFPAPN